jgi:hypothetical protein
MAYILIIILLIISFVDILVSVFQVPNSVMSGDVFQVAAAVLLMHEVLAKMVRLLPEVLLFLATSLIAVAAVLKEVVVVANPL